MNNAYWKEEAPVRPPAQLLSPPLRRWCERLGAAEVWARFILPRDNGAVLIFQELCLADLALAEMAIQLLRSMIPSLTCQTRWKLRPDGDGTPAPVNGPLETFVEGADFLLTCQPMHRDLMMDSLDLLFRAPD